MFKIWKVNFWCILNWTKFPDGADTTYESWSEQENKWNYIICRVGNRSMTSLHLQINPHICGMSKSRPVADGITLTRLQLFCPIVSRQFGGRVPSSDTLRSSCCGCSSQRQPAAARSPVTGPHRRSELAVRRSALALPCSLNESFWLAADKIFRARNVRVWITSLQWRNIN